MKSSGEFNATLTRNKLKGNVVVDREKLMNYPFKPFDLRVAYLDNNIAPLFSRPSPELLNSMGNNNWFVVSRNSCKQTPEGAPLIASSLVCDYSVISSSARHFPVWITNTGDLLEKDYRANLSEKARAYLQTLGFNEPDQNKEAAEVLWLHALAIGYAPAYRQENADGLKIDWPHIPLPNTRALLKNSAKMGEKVRSLLDMETPLSAWGETDIKLLAQPQGDMSNLALADFWGYKDGKGKVYPGKGKTEARHWENAELSELGLPYDVYMNNNAWWANVPARAWEFRIGGFQPAKKWLSPTAPKKS